MISDLCCGCETCRLVCPQSAIEIKPNEKGFWTPKIDKEKCVNCGLCEKYCPSLNRVTIPETDIKETYSFRKKRGRMESRSGGAFTAIAEQFLKMDNSSVYGVSFDGKIAKYTRAIGKQQLEPLKKSKYVQAKTGNIFTEVGEDLNKDYRVLFSGTACQIDGLYSYLKYKKIDTKNLYTIDLVCYGIPSPKVLSDYLNYCEESKNIRDYYFEFRYKEKGGWGDFFEIFRVDNKLIKSKNFARIFTSDVCLNNNCFNCKYSNLNRITDLTIGDFWDIARIDPFSSDGNRASLIIVNDKKGKYLFDSIKCIGKWKRYDYIESTKQKSLHESNVKPGDYDMFWQRYKEKGFLCAVKNYCDFNENDFVIYKKFEQSKNLIKYELLNIKRRIMLLRERLNKK